MSVKFLPSHVRGRCLTIHTQAGDSPTVSILKSCFPLGNSVGISLFWYKKFVVALMKMSSWTAEPEKPLPVQRLCTACVPFQGGERKKEKAEE